MKKHILLYIFLLVVPLYPTPIYAAIKGSTTAVSIEPFFEFLASDTDNSMQGFGWFKNGFSLQDNTTTCTFQSVYPVSGTINLNGGTLTLLEDLIFKNFTLLQGLGIVQGNNYVLDFCATITALPANADTFENVYMAFSNPMLIQGPITFSGSCVLDGRGNTVALGSGGSIIVASGSTLQCKNLYFSGISGTNISCVDNTASLVLDNIEWAQNGDFTFSNGSISIQSEVDFIGSYTFSYESMLTSTIQAQSEWCISDNMQFEIGKNPTSDLLPLAFVDHTSILHLDNCTYVITQSGMEIINGTIMYSRDVDIEIQSTDTTNGSLIGNGIAANDPIVQFNPGATASFLNGHLVWDVVNTNNLQSDSTSVELARSNASTYYIKQNITLTNLTVSAQPLTTTIVAPGLNLNYNQCLFTLPNGQIELTGSRYNAYTTLLDGNDLIFLHYGTLPLVTYVEGTGNSIQGNGNIIEPIVLLAPTAALTMNLAGSLSANLMLNGGTVTLQGGLTLIDGAVISTGGTMNLSAYSLDLPAEDTMWSAPIQWQAANANINLNGSTSLSGEWIFTGNTTINGNGNTLDLSDGGTLVVNNGVTLTLKNVSLSGLSNTSILMVDNGSQLVLDDVTWVQNTDISFDTGSITFIGEVDFVGSSTFAYDSLETSTLATKTNWQIGDGMQLSIGRNGPTGSEPLYFTDSTSILNLDNCILNVTPLGLPLSRGQILCTRDVTVDIASTSTVNGICIGDGTPSGDMLFEFYPGCSVNFNSGHVVYNVTNPNSVQSRSTTSTLIRGATSVFYMQQNIILSNVTIDAAFSAVTNVADGKTFSYDNCVFLLPSGSVVVNGERYNAFTNLLTNNNSLFLTSGMNPMYTLVGGAGNTILGNGSLTGQVEFLSNSANLTIAIDGIVGENITLDGGTLNLGQDTHFTYSAVIADSGTVNLNSVRFELCSQGVVWPGTINWQSEDGIIALDSDLELSGTWIFNNNCTIEGYGNVIDLSSGGSIQVASGATLKLSNVRLKGVSGTNVSCVDDTSNLILDSTVWVQEGDFIFSNGSITFNDTVDFIGSYTFTYASKKSSVINEESTWHITDAMQFVMGKQLVSDAQNPLLFTDVTSILNLDNCSFVVTNSGWDLLKGCIQYTGEVSIDVLSTSTMNGVSLGDGTSGNDPLVLFDPGSNASFIGGHVLYNIVNTANLVSNSTTVQMTRLAGSYFDIKQNIILKNFTIDASAFAVTFVETGVAFAYDNCIFILPNGTAQITANRYDAVSNVLTANDVLLMQYGAMPMATLVEGAGNIIAGTGNITGPIVFLAPTAALACDLSGSIEANIMLNGGTFSLQNDIKFATNAQFIGGGLIELGGNQISFGPQDTVWTGTFVWQANGGKIDFKADVDLSSMWTFTGQSGVLDCNGNLLDLSNGGELVVGSSCTLHIKNAQIKGIVGSNIRCVDNTSSLILENITWVQESDYQFESGSILFKQDVELCGNGVFAYQTMETSTICEWSCLSLDLGITFSYDPLMTGTQLAPLNLITFADTSARLKLNGAMFWAVNGIELASGTILIKNNSTLASETAENGITLGTGQVENDCSIRFAGGATLTVGQGALNYNNVAPSSWSSANNLSTLYLADNTVLNIYQSLNAGVGAFLFGNNTTLNRAVGMDITGALTVQGELSFGGL